MSNEDLHINIQTVEVGEDVAVVSETKYGWTYPERYRVAKVTNNFILLADPTGTVIQRKFSKKTGKELPLYREACLPRISNIITIYHAEIMERQRSQYKDTVERVWSMAEDAAKNKDINTLKRMIAELEVIV